MMAGPARSLQNQWNASSTLMILQRQPMLTKQNCLRSKDVGLQLTYVDVKLVQQVQRIRCSNKVGGSGI